MGEIKFDPNNYRVHNDKNERLIRKSLTDCGAGHIETLLPIRYRPSGQQGLHITTK